MTILVPARAANSGPPCRLCVWAVAEREAHAAEADFVALADHGFAYSPVVDPRPVGRTEIGEDPVVAVASQLGMPARHCPVIEHQVADGAPSRESPRRPESATAA